MSEENTQEQIADEPKVTLNDLQLLAQIVDLASGRGAFRGNELTQVGAVYDKLTGFLTHVAEKQKAEAEAAAAETEQQEQPETVEV
jgi:hypothetical protein